MPTTIKPAKRFTGTKRAVVAMLLRPSSSTQDKHIPTQPTATTYTDNLPPPAEVVPDDNFPDMKTSLDGLSPDSLSPDMDMFFIVRAENEKDRWSGQVGFPGGRQEKGENDLQTVQREVWEEIGLVLHVPNGRFNDLSKTPTFQLLGRVHDRAVRQGADTLVVACIVFIQRSLQTPPLNLSPKEVAFGAWCPIKALLQQDVGQPIIFSLSRSLFASTYPRTTSLVRFVGLSELCFTKVALPVLDVSGSALPKFMLWGMTLGMVNDALFDMTRLRSRPISLSRPGQIERIFTSDIHNLGVHMIRVVYKRVKGRSATWQQYVRIYLLSAGFMTVLVPTGVLVEVGKRALM